MRRARSAMEAAAATAAAAGLGLRQKHIIAALQRIYCIAQRFNQRGLRLDQFGVVL